jgi:DNA/RNA-binding domain of Phe-tRNA-synthetase-like protein
MSSKALSFTYDLDLFRTFPEARAGVIIGEGLENPPSPAALQALFLAEQNKTLAEIGVTPLSEIESLAAWRNVFRRFGVNPTKYRSAVEALLRRLVKKGEIPSINTLVDIGNLVSIRYRLPVAIFDTGRLGGQITVRAAAGDENFTPLFSDQSEHPEAGEVIFLDSGQTVVARRWCWRQSDESAARAETQNIILVTEGMHPGAEEDIRAATADLLGLLTESAGGSYVSGQLGPGVLSFSG